MTLLEGLALVGAGGGALGTTFGGILVAYLQWRAKDKPAEAKAPAVEYGTPGPRHEAPDWMRDTWTRERAEKEAAEAQAQAAEIEARRDHRERIQALERANSNHQTELRLIGRELGQMREATERNSALLGTLRDHILTSCPQCKDSDSAVVVRGGAALR